MGKHSSSKNPFCKDNLDKIWVKLSKSNALSRKVSAMESIGDIVVRTNCICMCSMLQMLSFSLDSVEASCQTCLKLLAITTILKPFASS